MRSGFLPLILLAFFCLPGQAQDIHFTMYDMSPLTLNPAHTGAFSGTVRIGGIYRDQWASVIDRQYQTPSFYADAPILPGFRQQDWIGVGLTFLTDRAGSANLRNNASMLSASYHFAFDADRKTVLTLGVQGGTTSRRLDILSTDLKFADEIDAGLGGGGLGAGNSPDRETNDETSALDINAGLMLRQRLGGNDHFELGFAMHHINNPEYNFLSNAGGSNNNNDENNRPARTTIHGRYYTELTDIFSLTPSFLFQSTAGTSEIALQALGGMKINEDFTLQFGPGYRFEDAVQVMAGVKYKNLTVRLAYDINTSPLSGVSNGQGGFEIAANYIIKINKDPEVPTATLCPAL